MTEMPYNDGELLKRYEEFYDLHMTPEQKALIEDRGFELTNGHLPLQRPSKPYLLMHIPGPIQFFISNSFSIATFGRPDPSLRTPCSIAGQIEEMVIRGLTNINNYPHMYFASPPGQIIPIYSDPQWRPAIDILRSRYPVNIA